MSRTRIIVSGLLLALGVPAVALAASPSHYTMPKTAALLKAERTAMVPLTKMGGIWRGPATGTGPSGKPYHVTQTERVGPFLGKTVMVMEGRGYKSDGHLGFHAFGVISYNPMTKAYSMNAYADGFAGNFKLDLTPGGFTWSIPEGPVTMRYTATFKDGTWHEVGARVVAGEKPVQTFEMTLKRVSGTDWPAAGAVPFKP